MARILIIDADQKTAEQTAQTLRAAGHQCLVETSAARVERIAERNGVELFLTEAMLPGASGFEVCRRIRRHPNLYTAPVMVFSTMSDEEEVKHGLAQGADDYMAKPVDSAQLVQRVAALMADNADCLEPDKLTGLPGAKRVRRELQRKSSAATQFALANIEMVHLPAVVERYGATVRAKAITWLAQTLCDRLKRLVPPEGWFLGHTGAGHFVCILAPEHGLSFCTYFRESFQRHREELYEAMGLRQAYRAAVSGAKQEKAAPLLDVLLCVTNRGTTDVSSPSELFDVLSRIRHRALSEQGGGVFSDRRRGRDRRAGDDRRTGQDRRTD